VPIAISLQPATTEGIVIDKTRKIEFFFAGLLLYR
jgi:hypothetical protein